MPKRSFVLWAVMLAVVGCSTQVEPGKVPAQAKSATGDAKPVEQRIDGTQVTTVLRLSKSVVRPGEKLEVAVELKIAPLWEIHPLDAQAAESATKLELVTPAGISAAGEWSEPETTRSMGASGQRVHVGRVVFKRSLAVDSKAVGTHEIVCRVQYQVCNDRQCLKPEELTLRVPVVVSD